MIILGLDPSQSAGWALYDPKATDLASVKAGTLRASGDGYEYKAGSLGCALVDMIKVNGKPGFAVVERAPRQQFGGGKKPMRFMGQELPDAPEESGGSGLQSVLSTNQMCAALCSILGAYKIPFVTMTDSEWRKASYGFGRRPGWTRPDWKRHARQLCQQNRISVTNDDMAEAVWIAFAGKGSDAYRMLQARKAA